MVELLLFTFGKFFSGLSVICSILVLKNPQFYLFLGNNFRKVRNNLVIIFLLIISLLIGLGFILDKIRYKEDFIINSEGESLTDSIIYILFGTNNDLQNLQIIGNSFITIYAKTSIISPLITITLAVFLVIISLLFLLSIIKHSETQNTYEYRVAVEKYNRIFKWNYMNEPLNLTDKERKILLKEYRFLFTRISIYLLNIILILHMFNILTISYIANKFIVKFAIFEDTQKVDCVLHNKSAD